MVIYPGFGYLTSLITRVLQVYKSSWGVMREEERGEIAGGADNGQATEASIKVSKQRMLPSEERACLE